MSFMVSGIVVAVVSQIYEYPSTPAPPLVAAVQETSMVVSVLQVEVVWLEEVKLETMEGPVVSTTAEPFEE